MRLYPLWEIRHDAEYTSPLEALLTVRGLRPEDLEIGVEALHPPELMADMDVGVARLVQAVRRGEQIVVFGDYDVDGVTSTVLMLESLERMGARCGYLLPDRNTEGYGLKPAGVTRALEMGAQLVVTVDNGISAFEALDLATGHGLDVVVTDHHHQLDRLPAAVAVIDPNRRDCPYPYKGLAGVGVAFKVVQALARELLGEAERRTHLNRVLDLVALGTVADVMPVLGENRVLIQGGLRMLERAERPGLRQLKAIAGYTDRSVTTTALAFHLGPRLNGAGRLGSADLAVQLLRTRDEAQAAALADELNRLNVRRQELQRVAMAEAEVLARAEDLERDRLLVLLGENWHLGVVGLLAGKLAERYNRPVAVCSAWRGDGTYTGSARSIPGYDISAGVGACARHLLAYGGHPAAAGFTLPEQSFEAFRLDLVAHANARLTDDDLHPRLAVDLVLRPRDVSAATLTSLARLEPFGNGNEVPVFAVRDCRVGAVRTVGRDNAHLKAELWLGEARCSAVWWGRGEVSRMLGRGQLVTAAFNLEIDTYAGGNAVQLVLKDLAPQDTDPGRPRGGAVPV
ncbi:MAG: single-stranded-DNA-specific exonuclease RecJ [Candidatus Latescibacterota bacterium]|jgi:single-stranded-DNA-specific exonuclease